MNNRENDFVTSNITHNVLDVRSAPIERKVYQEISYNFIDENTNMFSQ